MPTAFYLVIIIISNWMVSLLQYVPSEARAPSSVESNALSVGLEVLSGSIGQ